MGKERIPRFDDEDVALKGRSKGPAKRLSREEKAARRELGVPVEIAAIEAENTPARAVVEQLQQQQQAQAGNEPEPTVAPVQDIPGSKIPDSGKPWMQPGVIETPLMRPRPHVGTEESVEPAPATSKDEKLLRQNALRILKYRDMGISEEDIEKNLKEGGMSQEAVSETFKLMHAIGRSRAIKAERKAQDEKQRLSAERKEMKAMGASLGQVETKKGLAWEEPKEAVPLGRERSPYVPIDEGPMTQVETRVPVESSRTATEPYDPRYDAPEMDAEKLKFDPAHMLLARIAAEGFDIEDLAMVYKTKLPSAANAEGDEHTFANYHDFLQARLQLTPEQRAEVVLDAKGFEFPKYSKKIDFHGSYTTLENLRARILDPNDPLSKYRDEFVGIEDALQRGEIADVYADAVRAGLVMLPLEPASSGEAVVEQRPVEPSIAPIAVSNEQSADAAIPTTAAPPEPPVASVARIEAEEQDAIDRNIAAMHPRSAIEMELKSFDEAFDQLYPPEPGWLTTSAPDDVFDAFHQLKHEYRNAVGEERDAVADKLHAFLNDPEATGRNVDGEPATFEGLEEDTPLEEGTPLEWKNKLKGLIEGAKEKLTPSGERSEKMKKYLAGRTEALGEKAKKFGPGMEAFIRAKGEEYNKLSFLKKLLIGGTLGIGAAAFSTVSTPLATAFAINLGIQRFAGMAGMFLKTEKYLQDKKGSDIGFGSLSIREDRYKEAAATWAIGYTALMGTVIGEGVHLASESSYGQAVHEWLGRMLEHRPVSAPDISKDTTAPAPAAAAPAAVASAPMPTASAPGVEAPAQAQPAEAAASATTDETTGEAQGESATAAKPETVASAAETAQSASTNTATFEADASAQPQAPAQPAPEVTGTPQAPEASNVASVDVKATEGRGYEYMTKRLWEQLQEKNIKLPSGANPNSDLAKLLAADKDSIDAVVHQLAQENQFFKETGASVRINLDSHMSIDANGNIVLDGKNLAPGGPTTTPAMPGGIEKVDAASSLSQGESLIPDAANERPAGVAGGTATEVTVNPGSSGEDILIRTQEPAPLVDKDFVVNKFDIAIPLAEPHLYAGPTGENAVYAFGGDKKERLEAIYDYLSANPKASVIAADESGKYRATWFMTDGKMTSSDPLRKTGFLGIFNAFMSPPEPGELTKLIK